MGKKGIPQSWRTVEIEQQCRYGFTAEYVTKLCEEWSVIKDYAWILQDKDTNKDGTLKEPHIHLMCRFKSPVPTTAILSKLEGVCEVQQLEKMKNWNGAMAYLTHMNAPEKHQYNDDEVHSNFDWKADAEKAMAGKKRLETIVNDIAEGVIKRYNLYEYITAVEYTSWQRQIENAFIYRDISMFGEVDRNMDVLYLYGGSGTGKTTYAKRVASDRGMSLYISSSGKDFLDGYAGQECIILDDFRGSTAPLSTILKLLDNNTASSVASRYHNKSISECKLIIITSVQSPTECFMSAFKDNQEPLAQFKRRCQIVMEFREDAIITKMYNNSLQDYVQVAETPNIVLDEIKKSFNPVNQLEYLSKVLGGTGDLMKAVADKLKEAETQRDDILEGQQEIEF